MTPNFYQSIANQVKKYPSPTAGLALGVAGIGVNWDLFFPSWGIFIQLSCALIAMILLLPVIGKYIIHPSLLITDIEHHILGGILPTTAMTMMVISRSVDHFSLEAGAALWCTAIVLHIILLSKFIIYRIQHFELNHMVPTWFIPPIGIVVASVTVPNNPLFLTLAQIIAIYGLITYLLILPIMLFRLILRDTLDIAAQPSLAILAAPASLCLAGYLTVIPNPDPIGCLMLLGIGLLMTILVYVKLFYLLKLTFTPAFSAYTFPLAISVTALYKSYLLLHSWPFHTATVSVLYYLVHCELVIASTIIAYILIKYIQSFILLYKPTKIEG